MKPMNLALGLALLGITAAPAFANNGHHYGWYKHGGWYNNGDRVAPTQTPEIDPGMFRGGMVLLVGGVLALTDRRRRS